MRLIHRFRRMSSVFGEVRRNCSNARFGSGLLRGILRTGVAVPWCSWCKKRLWPPVQLNKKEVWRIFHQFWIVLAARSRQIFGAAQDRRGPAWTESRFYSVEQADSRSLKIVLYYQGRTLHPLSRSSGGPLFSERSRENTAGSLFCQRSVVKFRFHGRQNFSRLLVCFNKLL